MGYPFSLLSINAILFSAFFIAILLTFYQLIKTMEEGAKAQSRQLYMESLSEYTKRMESLYAQSRKFKHDYRNILDSMQIFLNANDLRGLKDYFYEIINPSSLSHLEKDNIIGELVNIKFHSLKGILFSKILCAKEQNVDFSISIINEVNSLEIDEFDFIRIIGIFLDNAIEGALETSSPILNLHIFSENEQSTFLIENSCALSFLPAFSTKGNSRGIGLSNVSELLSQYPNVFLSTCLKDNIYTQKLTIPSKPK